MKILKVAREKASYVQEILSKINIWFIIKKNNKQKHLTYKPEVSRQWNGTFKVLKEKEYQNEFYI